MSSFVRNKLSSETRRFTVRISNFSAFLAKGYFVSPEFEDVSSGNKWSLIVDAKDGTAYENFIDVHLKRDARAINDQYVKVKISIVGFLRMYVLKNQSGIYFSGLNETRVLRVTKDRRLSYFGLNKSLYLSNDTLILKCELIIQESVELNFHSKEDFVATARNSVPCGVNNLVEYFAHGHMVSKSADCFTRQVNDFSVHTYRGRFVCPEYESNHSGSKWSLVVYRNDGDRSDGFIDIRIKQSGSKDQLANVKLSVIGLSGEVLLSSEKYVNFTGPTEVQLISAQQKYWFGPLKRSLTPSDTLTLQCEVVLFEEVCDTFAIKEEFDETSDSFATLLPILLLYAMIFIIIIAVGVHVFVTVICAILEITAIIWDYVKILLDFCVIVLNTFFIILIIPLFHYVKESAERRTKERQLMNSNVSAQTSKIMTPKSNMLLISSETRELSCNGNYARNRRYQLQQAINF